MKFNNSKINIASFVDIYGSKLYKMFDPRHIMLLMIANIRWKVLEDLDNWLVLTPI